MKLIFAHDHRFLLDDNGSFFSPGKLNNNSFSRYLKHFSSLLILSRFEKYDELLVGNNKINKINSDRIKFNGFDNQSNLLNRFFKRPYYFYKMKTIIQQYDGLVVRVPSEIGFLASRVARAIDMPYVCEVVACPEDAMNGIHGIKSKLYKPILVNEMKKCVENATGALYVTDSFLQNRYPCAGFVASASNVEITSTVEKPKCSTIKGKSPVKVCLIGNLDSPHKGYDTLFMALNKISSDSERNFIVYLVGAGNKYKQDCHLDNVEVIYTGSLTSEMILSHLDDMDIYIQPSNQEGLPRATIEAMSRALPCIVSNAGGLPELIDDKYVHNVGDYEGLANKILDIIDDNEEYNIQSSINLIKSKKYLSKDLSTVRDEFFKKYNKEIINFKK